MRRVCAGLAVAAAAAASAVAVPGALGSPPARCAPVAVQFTAASERWIYTVEASGIGCPAARAVARREAAQPWTGRGGWRCTIGSDRASWAFSCVQDGAVVRAYGPTLERGSWAGVARRLAMPVLEPASTPGLVFDGIAGEPRCDGVGRSDPWLFAAYSGPGGATLTIAEGKPAPCGDLGLAPRVAVWRVHGQSAELLENCAPSGCARLQGAYVLTWRERGITVTLLTDGVDQTTLLAIARGLHPVS